MAGVWSPEWLVPEMVDRVIGRLRWLHISAKQKKYALYEWCKIVGVELTAEMVERVTGLPAGEI